MTQENTLEENALEMSKVIKPSAKYDRANFVEGMDVFDKLRGYKKRLEDSKGEDPESRIDLGELLRKNPTHYAGHSGGHVIKQAKEAISDLEGMIGGWTEPSQDRKSLKREKGYVENNLDEFLNRLTANELFALINNLPLYNTNNPEIDRLIRIIRETQKISRAEKGKEEEVKEQVREYVSERMKKAPAWLQRSFSYSVGDPNFVMEEFESYRNAAMLELSKATRNEKGELNKDLFVRVLKESLAVAQREYNRETNLGDKSDIFEGDIRPYYLTLAQVLYPREKEEREREKDPDGKKRQDERRALGMPV